MALPLPVGWHLLIKLGVTQRKYYGILTAEYHNTPLEDDGSLLELIRTLSECISFAFQGLIKYHFRHIYDPAYPLRPSLLTTVPSPLDGSCYLG